MKKYPFKHLAAYEREDKAFYKGRDEEINELYQMTFKTDLLLVFGASGVGKTSLILCGLANKFESYEWLNISVRRGNNINESLTDALNDQIKPKKANGIAEQIRMLRQRCFCPVYLIFDQFEELYISGGAQEQKDFYDTVREILSLNQPVKIIISIREEYFSHLYEFEKVIPQLFSHKCRIKPKSVKLDESGKNIINEILQGVAENEDESNVRIENADELAKAVKSLFEDGTEEAEKKVKRKDEWIDLPSLQLLFREFYSFQSEGRPFDSEIVTSFSAFDFKKFSEKIDIRNVKDIVWEYLENLIDDKLKGAKSEGKKVEPNIVWWFLLELITVSGTKKSMSVTDLKKNLEGYDNSVSEIDDITKIFGKNDEENANTLLNSVTQGDEILWELRHDALAKCIREKLDPEIRLRYLIKEKVNLNSSQIEEIKDKKDKKKRLLLSKNEEEWVKKCERRIKIQKWGYRIGFAVILCLLIVAVYGWLEANKARDLAKNNEKNAAVELYKRYQSELKDLEKRVMIIKEAELDPQVIDKEKNIIENEISKIKDKIPDIEQIIEKKEVIK